MGKLTDKQRRSYIGSGGVKCPFCEDYDIEGQAVEIDDGFAIQPVSCKACNKSWTDIYKLHAIREAE